MEIGPQNKCAFHCTMTPQFRFVVGSDPPQKTKSSKRASYLFKKIGKGGILPLQHLVCPPPFWWVRINPPWPCAGSGCPLLRRGCKIKIKMIQNKPTIKTKKRPPYPRLDLQWFFLPSRREDPRVAATKKTATTPPRKDSPPWPQQAAQLTMAQQPRWTQPAQGPPVNMGPPESRRAQ